MSSQPSAAGPRRTRRSMLRTTAAVTLAGALGHGTSERAPAAQSGASGAKGRLQQSLCRWCYSKIDLDDLCSTGKRLNLAGIDLLTPKDFPTIKKYGLVCTMTSSHPLANG